MSPVRSTASPLYINILLLSRSTGVDWIIVKKFFLIAFAVIAAVAADVSHLPSNEYLPPVQEAAPVAAPTSEYLPPVQQVAPVESAPAHELADDGYRYKTNRRVVYRRNRRDVSHLPSNEYLPPVQQEAAPVVAPTNEYLPPVQQVESAPAHELADDGYRYKTNRRVVYRRNRRDVSHLPSNEYLPPVQQEAVEVAPVQEVSNAVVEEAVPAHELADDGYRYKTNRRVVYRRNRRDVSHLPSNEYLPPVQESAPVVDAPVQEFAVVEEAAPAHELADDGYRYKTHRRVVYRRNRRDVSHLPSNEYLPPVQEAAPVEVAPVQEYAAVEEAVPAHELADDGYRYKTHRRVVIRRNRRDVSHLPSNEYLPPVQESAAVEVAPVQEVAVVEEAVPAHELADDGYRYKTNRRVVYRRNRRDVSHLPSNEYLPPVQESAPVDVAPVQEVAVVEEAVPAHELADDGYRYKTHRRVVYRRNRRDVSHLPSNEYLPPVQESAPVEETPVVVNVVEEAVPAHELADDGYRYKTHRRVVYRRNRRDVSHLPSNEYLPPVQEAAPVEVAPVQEVAVVEEAVPAHELAADGYRYKTNRRVVYRRNRRDVSHLPSNEYLPPVQQEAVVAAPTNEYLPPVQQDEAVPAHELSADGYRYKTQRRVVYRRH
ncbi:uncharacterized protein LOC135954164 [Calliphora vicina]|uniref:uncharacterized protein LOC135954164 n=1 Tax=Calliphora vicina TaxID=7373 RepID=UPI00325B8700